MTTFEATPWEERQREQMAAFAAKKAKEKAERAQMKRRRAYGKAIQHAARLAPKRTENTQQ